MIEDGTKAVIKKSQSILETKAVTNFAIQHDLPQINYDEVYKTHSIFFKKIIKRIKYNPFLDFSNLYAYRLEDASQTLNTYKDRIENYETIDNLYDELIRIERDKKRFSDSDVKEFFELLPLFNIETLILCLFNHKLHDLYLTYINNDPPPTIIYSDFNHDNRIKEINELSANIAESLLEQKKELIDNMYNYVLTDYSNTPIKDKTPLETKKNGLDFYQILLSLEYTIKQKQVKTRQEIEKTQKNQQQIQNKIIKITKKWQQNKTEIEKLQNIINQNTYDYQNAVSKTAYYKQHFQDQSVIKESIKEEQVLYNQLIDNQIKLANLTQSNKYYKLKNTFESNQRKIEELKNILLQEENRANNFKNYYEAYNNLIKIEDKNKTFSNETIDILYDSLQEYNIETLTVALFENKLISFVNGVNTKQKEDFIGNVAYVALNVQEKKDKLLSQYNNLFYQKYDEIYYTTDDIKKGSRR